ncbi:aminotransferase class I and II family protein [Mycobacterium xenopi 3993]|nr:aminotransferase class I and II family protein [Mycobacterium xenopi 3993]
MNASVALRAGIPPFYVMDVWLAAAERQRTHGDLVNLSAGQPSAGAPPGACRGQGGAGQQPAGLHGGPWHSRTPGGHCAGIYAAAWDQRRADDVVITTGSSGGFLLAFLACFDVGDRVVVTSPGYPCYRNILSALGCEVVDVPCGPDTRFQPTAQLLAALDPHHAVSSSQVRPTRPGPSSHPRSWRRSHPGARNPASDSSATRCTTALCTRELRQPAALGRPHETLWWSTVFRSTSR